MKKIVGWNAEKDCEHHKIVTIKPSPTGGLFTTHPVTIEVYALPLSVISTSDKHSLESHPIILLHRTVWHSQWPNVIHPLFHSSCGILLWGTAPQSELVRGIYGPGIVVDTWIKFLGRISRRVECGVILWGVTKVHFQNLHPRHSSTTHCIPY